MSQVVVSAGDDYSGRQVLQEDFADWYLAYTKSRQEALAKLNLERQGFEVYLPLYKVFAQRGRAMHLANEPMFPQYLFFKPSHSGQSISVVRSTTGVLTIIRFSAEPAIVNAQVVQSIRDFERQRNCAEPSSISPFQPGTHVRLRAGALRGIEGLVTAVSSKRVSLLLEILGRQKVVEVVHDQLELAAY